MALTHPPSQRQGLPMSCKCRTDVVSQALELFELGDIIVPRHPRLTVLDGEIEFHEALR
jgi:hypothetical protein